MNTRTRLAALISSLAFVAHVGIAAAQNTAASALAKTAVLVYGAAQ
ncbi:hypothetical protein [Pseudomonas antarctica]